MSWSFLALIKFSRLTVTLTVFIFYERDLGADLLHWAETLFQQKKINYCI